jgi:hypothetical protein
VMGAEILPTPAHARMYYETEQGQAGTPLQRWWSQRLALEGLPGHELACHSLMRREAEQAEASLLVRPRLFALVGLIGLELVFPLPTCQETDWKQTETKRQLWLQLMGPGRVLSLAMCQEAEHRQAETPSQ